MFFWYGNMTLIILITVSLLAFKHKGLSIKAVSVTIL